VYTLVDVIEDHQIGDKIYEDILKRADEIVERIVRRIVPEIAERVIKEEIEKIKNEPS
jgi:fructose-1,6-bisphosphatase/inositol monophosphatase family enzyme